MADTAQEIPVHYRQKFTDDIKMRAQQMNSTLRDKVDSSDESGEIVYIESFGEVTPIKNNERLPKSPVITTPRFKRQLSPDRYQSGDGFDRFDIVKYMNNPQPKIIDAHAAGMARNFDDVIIPALGGTAIAVNDDKTTTNVALPASQKVGVQVGSAVGSPVDCGMNEAKVRKALQIIGEGKVDIGLPMNKVYGLIDNKALYNDLMSQDRVVSGDYNRVKVLVEGRLIFWMGMEWIVSTRLEDDANGDTSCYVWAKSGVHLGIWEDLYINTSIRNDLSDSAYVYLESILAATRLEEAKVVQIAIDKTATATGV